MVMLLSTSGNSRNLVRAAEAARAAKATTWTITGPAPNRLALVCDDAICLDAPAPHVQEAQLVAIHALCRVFDGRVTQPSVDGPLRTEIPLRTEVQGGQS
jgi:DNA-binding MurR/RpiR family transcriptional regulator